MFSEASTAGGDYINIHRQHFTVHKFYYKMLKENSELNDLNRYANSIMYAYVQHKCTKLRIFQIITKLCVFFSGRI